MLLSKSLKAKATPHKSDIGTFYMLPYATLMRNVVTAQMEQSPYASLNEQGAWDSIPSDRFWLLAVFCVDFESSGDSAFAEFYKAAQGKTVIEAFELFLNTQHEDSIIDIIFNAYLDTRDKSTKDVPPPDETEDEKKSATSPPPKTA